jgi:hypothetical protein
MLTYLYSKWLNNQKEFPHEFYSELDGFRNEIRKIEIFNDGTIGYASQAMSAHGTRLSIEPVPSMQEIQAQKEFETKEISKEEFESKWADVSKN